MVRLLPLFFLLFASLPSCTRSGDSGRVSVPAGGKAPDFTAKDLSGMDVKLSAHAGRVVLLEFWATWCPPCRSSIPGLVALQNKYGGRGLTILAVSVDEGQNLTAKLSDFSKENGINYSVLIGEEAVSDAYSVRSIPALFLIDKTGKIVSSHTGAPEDLPAALSAEIEKLL